MNTQQNQQTVQAGQRLLLAQQYDLLARLAEIDIHLAVAGTAAGIAVELSFPNLPAPLVGPTNLELFPIPNPA